MDSLQHMEEGDNSLCLYLYPTTEPNVICLVCSDWLPTMALDLSHELLSGNFWGAVNMKFHMLFLLRLTTINYDLQVDLAFCQINLYAVIYGSCVGSPFVLTEYDFSREITTCVSNATYIYYSTPSHKQDVTQGQFLSRV